MAFSKAVRQAREWTAGTEKKSRKAYPEANHKIQ